LFPAKNKPSNTSEQSADEARLLLSSSKFKLHHIIALIAFPADNMSAAADDTMADAPPPLPPVVLPPMMTTDATAADAQEVPVPETNTATASTQEDEVVVASDGLINFDVIMTELQSWQSENNGSLAIPSSHPVSLYLMSLKNRISCATLVLTNLSSHHNIKQTLMRIIDSITNTGLESLATKRWEDQLLALTSYKQRYGTCDVPLNHPTLGTWAAEQRNQYRAYEKQLPTTLTVERYEKLKNIGITINRWEKRLVELKAYRLEHGHCDVPIDHPSGLGIWVSTQREHAHWNREEMPEERIASLDAVGFNWNRWGHSRTKNRQDAWETQFIKLTEFIREQGHSNISQHDKDNGKLGKWVKNQRYEYRKFMNKGLGPSRLGRDRIEKLESIGFQWRLRPEIIPWETRFEVSIHVPYLSYIWCFITVLVSSFAHIAS
jgi:hypothetical protein